MSEPLQLFPALPPAIEDALRYSIRRFGVLVPVVKDQHGRTLDGHHRSRIATEENVKFRVDVVTVADDDEAREIAHTLNSDRRQLDPEQRKQIVADMRRAGYTYREIGGALGVEHTTAMRDAKEIGADAPISDRVARRGGGTYPARRPTIIAALTDRDAERVVKALGDNAGLMDDRPETNTAFDVLREARKERDRQARVIRRDDLADATGASHRLICGDFTSADVADESVELIVTDPPYPEEFASAWHDLAAFAERVLVPGGIVVAMTGKIHLPDRMAALGARLQYGWMYAQELPGNNTRILGRHIAQEWKPWLAYSKGPWPAGRIDWHGDLIVDVPQEKTHYHWQQSVDPAESLIRSLCSAEGTVCDPFLGSGTYGVAALKAGRRFIGIEMDADRFRIASDRMAVA